MEIRFFIGDEPEHEHEWKQLKQIFDIINEKYAKSDEIIYILYNFLVSNNQIDVLILTAKGIALIDLKAYKGKVIGNENGDWYVNSENGVKVPLNKNLFKQLKDQRFAFVKKLNLIRKGNFENIEEKKLIYFKCWGYFEKGSSYDIKQIGQKARIWFDVITGDDLIEKMRFLGTGYRFKDMEAIVKGLNLKESLIEELISSKSQAFESNYRKELSVFIKPGNWSEIRDKIFSSNILVIVGDPRVGKTTTTANIAKELKKEGYEVREGIDSLIRQYYSREDDDRKNFKNTIKSKNVFIIDDVFGDTEYDSSLGNERVPIIKELLSSKVKSKFVFTSRTDIFEKFQNSNKELSYTGLEDAFRNSVVKINTSDYSAEKKKEIFEKNLEFSKIKEENKKLSLTENNKKIITELVHPGEISDLLKNVKGNYGLINIDDEIEKAKSQVKFIKEQIKSLDNHKKLFLYNIYINKNFSYDDLEVIYSHCLSFNSPERNDFFECIEEFEDKYVKIKIVDYYFRKNIKKLEFVHPIYIDAIERLLKSDKKERKQIENILWKLNEIVRLKIIVDWESTNTKYDYIQLYSYLIAIRNYDVFSIQIKDLVIENLESLSFGFLCLHGRHLELEENEFHDVPENPTALVEHEVKYVKELFVNYEKFDDDLKKYINILFNIDSFKEGIAVCFAYHLDSITFYKFQDKLKELRNEETEFLIAKSLIKNYESLNKDNKELLFDLDIKKTLLIELLINNYNVLHTDLKQILTNKITELNKKQLIETGKTFLINYSYLPYIIRQKYDIMFDLENKDAIKQVGEAIVVWFDAGFTEFYDEKDAKSDEKIMELYCNWLKNEKIVLENFESIHILYGEAENSLQGSIESSMIDYDYLKLNKPKWTEASYLNLKYALIDNMIILLNSFPSNEEEFPTYIEKTKIYVIAFIFYSWCENKELIKRIGNILYETDEIKYIFLEDCSESLYKIQKPIKISIPQIELIRKLSKPSNHPKVRAKANEVLNYITALID